MVNEIRDIIFSIRLTTEEYNALKRISARLNMSMAGYVRLKAVANLLESEAAEVVLS